MGPTAGSSGVVCVFPRLSDRMGLWLTMVRLDPGSIRGLVSLGTCRPLALGDEGSDGDRWRAVRVVGRGVGRCGSPGRRQLLTVVVEGARWWRPRYKAVRPSRNRGAYLDGDVPTDGVRCATESVGATAARADRSDEEGGVEERARDGNSKALTAPGRSPQPERQFPPVRWRSPPGPAASSRPTGWLCCRAPATAGAGGDSCSTQLRVSESHAAVGQTLGGSPDSHIQTAHAATIPAVPPSQA